MAKGSSGFDNRGGNLKDGFGGKWFGIAVTDKSGKNTEYFFKQSNKETLMSVGIERTPQKATVSPQKMYENARKNGLNPKIISPTQVEERKKKRREERAKNPDYEMGIGTQWGNKDNRRAARNMRFGKK